MAARTERTILQDMGQEDAGAGPLLDDALELAEKLVEDADRGRVDLADLSRRARRLLEASAKPPEPQQLF